MRSTRDLKKRSIVIVILYRIRVFKDSLFEFFRCFSLRLQGLQLGKGCKIGRIYVTMPEQVKIGNLCTLEDAVRLRPGGPWKQSYIEIGDRTFLGHSTQINVGNHISIGSDCMVAPLCVISDAHHVFDDLDTPMNKQPCIYKKIVLKDNVWIGSGCVILGGVTIGSGVVIAAGSVVNRDIPDNEVWGGVPVKKIKSRNIL